MPRHLILRIGCGWLAASGVTAFAQPPPPPACSGTFHKPATFTILPELRPAGVAIGDIDRDGSDGLIDLACTATFPDRVVWFKNLGLGDFQVQPPAFRVADSPWGIAAGQLDGIHRADLVTVNANGGFALTENISVLLHNGTTPPSVSRSDYLVNGQTLQRHYIALGDLDRNGCLDVVTSNNLSHDITVLLNLP